MMRRLVLAVLLAPLLAPAQMKLFVLVEGAEQAVTGSYQVGVAPAGGHLDTAFRVRNTAQAAAWFQGLTLAGQGFSFAVLPRLPALVEAGAAVDFTVRFAPAGLGSYSAFLSVNGETSILLGSGRAADPPKPPDPEPPKLADPPRPRIVVEPQALKGGQQAKVAVQFASPSEVAASGELLMEFKAAVPGRGDDSGVLFPATGVRRIAFTVAAGEALARFGGRAETEFQTGTTAGLIVFTARLGPHAEQLTATVPSGYIVIDGARTARSASGIEVEVTGYDTSRSASLASFTFFDRAGSVVAPGAIQVDVSRAFQQYFETTELGSVFRLRAAFPVSGDASRIGGVEAVLSNSLGSTQTKRLTVQ